MLLDLAGLVVELDQSDELAQTVLIGKSIRILIDFNPSLKPKYYEHAEN